MRRALGLVAALALMMTGCATVAERPAAEGASVTKGFLFEQLEDGGRTYRYAIFVPRGYDPAHASPLVLFLHGSGESGNDGAKMIIQGIGSAMLWNIDAWPAIVVFPQKPTEDSEWEQHESAVMAMLAGARARYNVDPARIYLTGLSQGGHGAFVLGARHSELWAAIVPICGYGAAHREGHDSLPPPFGGPVERLAQPLARIPLWAFHGEVDDVVPVAETKAVISAIESAGGKPKLSVLPGVNHGAWDPAYRDPELPKWLFAQHR